MSLAYLLRKAEDYDGALRETVWEGCWNCFSQEDMHLELTQKLKVRDVINVPTKAAKRSQNKKARKREEQAGNDIGGRPVGR